MKQLKIIVIAFSCVILFVGYNSFAQTPEGYGPWRSFTELPNLQYSTKRGDYDSSSGKYEWHVLFRNGYDKAINFDFALHDSDTSGGLNWGRTSLKAGQAAKSYLGQGGGFRMLRSADAIEVSVAKVRFGDDDSGPYLFGDGSANNSTPQGVGEPTFPATNGSVSSPGVSTATYPPDPNSAPPGVSELNFPGPYLDRQYVPGLPNVSYRRKRSPANGSYQWEFQNGANSTVVLYTQYETSGNQLVNVKPLVLMKGQTIELLIPTATITVSPVPVAQ
jgi:hypothetical protein